MTICTKFDEFSENFRMGGGSFPIRKISLRFFQKLWSGKNNEFSEKGEGFTPIRMNLLQIFGPPEKNATLFSENMVGGELRGRLEVFRKFIEFGPGSHPLVRANTR